MKTLHIYEFSGTPIVKLQKKKKYLLSHFDALLTYFKKKRTQILNPYLK